MTEQSTEVKSSERIIKESNLLEQLLSGLKDTVDREERLTIKGHHYIFEFHKPKGNLFPDQTQSEVDAFFDEVIALIVCDTDTNPKKKDYLKDYLKH